MALARCNLVITDGSGNIVNGAIVEVRRESDLGLPSLFSDRAGTIAIGNSFVATDGADAGFHVVGGAYKVTAISGAFTRIWRYVANGTAAENDAEAFGTISDVTNLLLSLADTNDVVALIQLQQTKDLYDIYRHELKLRQLLFTTAY
jgi:hypothetical protein